ncbi:thioesterase family protein [Mycolicibacterium mengxianglii]|uniref:thioesterase family protein n=1 Tax=Mycolicibacterium mengxianglii TaxID=2736649 RepID=UPI0018D0EB97|nr:thioesterase family protein [Mycolicibacterium mengxianglii]
MTPLFSHAMALRAGTVDGSTAVYTGELNPHWTIGPKIHGGVMLALCAKAARLALADVAGGDAEPVVVSANFLWAPDPGPVELVATMRKPGRRISLVDVDLIQGDRVAVRAAVTLGAPEHHVTPLLAANPVLSLMSPEPPAGLAPIGPGHPLADVNHLSAGCDIRPDLSGLRPGIEGVPRTRIWVRPRDEAPDVLFALLCGDISAPVTFAVERRGWAPTVQLTAYLRSRPADGWLRVLSTTTQIGQEWFDQDYVVVDCEDRLVAQTRQLALVPAPD